MHEQNWEVEREEEARKARDREQRKCDESARKLREEAQALEKHRREIGKL